MAKTPEELEKLKRAPEFEGMLEEITRRWSPLSFSDREVSNEDLKKLFEAARWAASSSNEQPWRFIFGRRGEHTFEKIFWTLADGNRIWAKNAAVLMLSAGKKAFTSNGKPNKYCLHDSGAAVANLMLQATHQGMHAHSMGGFDQDAARAAFKIPEEFEIGAVTAIGYLGDPNALPDPLRDREQAPRKRKSLAEFVFSEWDQAAQL